MKKLFAILFADFFCFLSILSLTLFSYYLIFCNIDHFGTEPAYHFVMITVLFIGVALGSLSKTIKIEER
jgi:hypothetical protein